ncbi:probable receptor-like serine/threonine-protein kinase At4g34500 isoform X2 [Cynara cardunculus var. scolymus]|uniref:probable receptor-like serine/threonine-protein kinase At4g34500 isoform X2 n=1 Tax=Cynara cardunculus var. scolymus TaxID=59895 RepID=UPI000D629332|nr:probable receptor-like serine/threonine-protein kinase At4g34500 isoform X2 [Cynara cardunculus var. scolymus]
MLPFCSSSSFEQGIYVFLFSVLISSEAMSVSGNTSSTDDGVSLLTSKTPILGQKLYVVIAVTVAGVTGVLVLIFLFLLYKQSSKRRNNRMRVDKHGSGMLPLSSETKTINLEVKTNCSDQNEKVGKTLISMFEMDNEERDETEPIIKAVDGKKLDNDTSGSNESGTATGTGTTASEGASSSVSSESMYSICWGRWFNLSELEIATNRFAEENVIGEGGYGIVYRGALPDGSAVAVKNLLDNRGQAEKEFKVEVEAIGKVRHKNLVGLIGFCTEGAKRLLVYEYVDNGNLEQWLHGDVGPTSPLTWDIRMKIAVGTAKGLAYLHEGLEPKVVHRDVKSSNILLDKKWNARVADFGLAKLLESEKSYVTTRVMGTFGYVSPDYASTGMLNEASDIYSFGVCLMEIVTGRSPVDHSRAPGEMNLVDWFRGMVASRRGEDLVDPKIEIQPSPRALKRVLLVCLCCTDMDASMRPKMGHIVHMLEADEFPFRRDPRPPRDTTTIRPDASAAGKVPLPTGNDE